MQLSWEIPLGTCYTHVFVVVQLGHWMTPAHLRLLLLVHSHAMPAFFIRLVESTSWLTSGQLIELPPLLPSPPCLTSHQTLPHWEPLRGSVGDAQLVTGPATPGAAWDQAGAGRR